MRAELAIAEERLVSEVEELQRASCCQLVHCAGPSPCTVGDSSSSRGLPIPVLGGSSVATATCASNSQKRMMGPRSADMYPLVVSCWRAGHCHQAGQAAGTG
jgi:hypothetical protein